MRFRRHGGSAIAARALSACCWFVLSWRQQLGLDCSTNETVDSSGASCLPACSLRMVLTGGARNRSRSRRPEDSVACPQCYCALSHASLLRPTHRTIANKENLDTCRHVAISVE